MAEKLIKKDSTTDNIGIYDSTGTLVRDLEDRGSDVTISSTETATAVAAGGTTVIPEGEYYIRCDADVSVEIELGSTWKTLISAGGTGRVISDGTRVRLSNSGGSSENGYLTAIQ